MNEKTLEKLIVDKLNTKDLKKLVIQGPNEEEQSLQDLLSDFHYVVLEDTSEWRNKTESFSVDVIGGMVPDIVICDADANKIRIIVEVKNTASFNYTLEDSQIVRYFLYLLCSTDSNDSKIPRAVLLAAPDQWFRNENNKRAYKYFIDTYKGIANKFNIIIGRLLIDNLL